MAAGPKSAHMGRHIFVNVRAIAYRLKSVMIAHFGSELLLKTACTTSNVDIMLSFSGYFTVNKADLAPRTHNST